MDKHQIKAPKPIERQRTPRQQTNPTLKASKLEGNQQQTRSAQKQASHPTYTSCISPQATINIHHIHRINKIYYIQDEREYLFMDCSYLAHILSIYLSLYIYAIYIYHSCNCTYMYVFWFR